MLQDEAGTNSEKNYEDIISEVRIIKQQVSFARLSFMRVTKRSLIQASSSEHCPLSTSIRGKSETVHSHGPGRWSIVERAY